MHVWCNILTPFYFSNCWSYLICNLDWFSENGDMCAMKEVTLFSDDAKSKESAKQLMQVS